MTVSKIERKRMGIEVSTGIDGWSALNHGNLNSLPCQVGRERSSPSAGTDNTDIKSGRHNTVLDLS
jgi:hypothetical protein